MYPLVCFILFVSLNGIKTENPTSSMKSSTLAVNPSSTGPSDDAKITTPISTTFSSLKTAQVQSTIMKPADCLISLSNMKESLLFLIIALLSLICFLLLMIIMCLTCKHCRNYRNDKMVVMKSSKPTRRTSVNGGPSETDLMLKDCSSVKVEIETAPDEVWKAEEASESADEVNQVFIEEKENSANDTGATSAMSPTQETAQSSQMDPNTGNDLETAE